MVSECATTEYECSDGRCLERVWVCDGYNDCATGEDELNCSKLSIMLNNLLLNYD